ncbi:hypothetical protein PCK2_000156 [Pneumocystis canis]|nr:hypothetical protein PCK2_000156 [Pneumocystis canis]
MENTEGINDADYELLEVIGHGSFGLIRKVRRKSDGMVFARKEIHYRKMEERERKQLASEVHILSNLRHPHIVRYFGRSIDRAHHTIYLYMEFCGNGDLGSLIKDCQQEKAYRKELEVLELRRELKAKENSLLKREENILAKEEELKNRERILYEKEMSLGKAIHAHVCRTQSEVDRFYSKTQEMGHSGERSTNKPSTTISFTHPATSLHCSSPVKDKRHTTIDSNLTKLSPTHFSSGERRQLTLSSIPIRQPLQENTSKLSNTVSKKTPVTPSRLRISPNSRKTLDSPLHTQG